MGVNSLPKTVTRQRCDCDLNPGHSAPESSTLTTRLPNHPGQGVVEKNCSTGRPSNTITSMYVVHTLYNSLCNERKAYNKSTTNRSSGVRTQFTSLATIDVRPTTYTSLSHRTSISVYSTMRRFIRAAWLILVYLNNRADNC